MSWMARTAGRLGLALLSSLLFGFYAWWPSQIWIPYICLIPWIVLYTDDRQEKVSALYFVLATWIAWMLMHPQVRQYGWFVPPVMAIMLVPTWWVFPFVLRPIHRRLRWPRVVTVPLVWVALEWFRSTFTLGHFDLYGLGYSQAAITPLVQIADITGVSGVTFWVAAVNGFLADTLFSLSERRWTWREVVRQRLFVRSAAALAAAMVLMLGYGLFRLATAKEEAGPRVAILQPNLPYTMRNVVGMHLSQLLLTDQRIPDGASDLILWPENAILDNIRRRDSYLDDLTWMGRKKGAMFLVGAMGKSTAEPGRTLNGAFLVDPRGEILGEYYKQVLFPWTEFVPFDGLFGVVSPRLQRVHRAMIRKAWGFLPPGSRGDETTVIDLPWKGTKLPMGVMICVENTYAPIPAEAARRGARFFANITSEGSVAGLVQEQLLRTCIFRSIENRVAYVRCGNSGISCFIDPQGRLRSVLRGERGGTIMDRGVLIDRVVLAPPTVTLYARSHEAFALLCVIAACIMVIGATGRPRRSAAILVVGVGLLTGCGAPIEPGSDEASAQAALERGQRLGEQRRHRAALPELAAACGALETCRRALPLLAEAFAAVQRYEDAADFFAAVGEKYPPLQAEAKSYEGQNLGQAFEFRRAEAAFRTSLELSPSAKTWEKLGRLQLRTNEQEASVKSLGEAVRLDPKDTSACYWLAFALFQNGRLAEARPLLETLVAADRQNAQAWSLLGRVLSGVGDAGGADLAWRTAALVDPRNIMSRYRLASVALREGRRGDVERLLAEIRKVEEQLGRGPREE